MAETITDDIPKDIVEKLSKIMKKLGINFIIKGRPSTYAEVFSGTGLLPAIAKRADQLCSLCMGYGIGVTFEDSPGTMTGNVVKFDMIAPEALRYLCLIDVLCELAKAAPDKRATSLDELLYD